MDRFKVIEGGGKPQAYRARKRGATELLVCHVCEQDLGVSTSVTFEGRQGRMIHDGKAQGGTKAIYCLTCLARGKTTKLV